VSGGNSSAWRLAAWRHVEIGLLLASHCQAVEALKFGFVVHRAVDSLKIGFFLTSWLGSDCGMCSAGGS
jgi:hypothetical protein